MTFIAGIIVPAAFEFYGNNVQFGMIMYATGLIIYRFPFNHKAIIARKW